VDTLQEILILVLLIGGIALIGVLISVLLSMRRTLETIGTDIRRLSDETVPLLVKIEETIEMTKQALTVVEENREKLAAATNFVHKVTENIYRLESMLQDQIEPSVAGLARRLSGLRRGVDTFVDRWRQGRG
jgi:chromosome segregation ATPase